MPQESVIKLEEQTDAQLHKLFYNLVRQHDELNVQVNNLKQSIQTIDQEIQKRQKPNKK